jgi:GNAT superfamily N-acetyltransferase
MALVGPMPLREAIASQLITKNQVPFHHAALTDSVVVCKSLATHPAWRGNNLANALVAFMEELPFTRAAAHIFAQISAGNKRSWGVFARNGFGIVAAVYDQADGQPRFIFQKPAFGFDFSSEIIVDDVIPCEDFPAIVNLTQREALVGTCDETASGKLAFLRSREALNLMPVLARVRSLA